MKKKYVLLNTYRHHVTYITIFIANFIIVSSVYYLGWLGEVTDHYLYLVVIVAVGSLFDPLKFMDAFSLLERLFLLDSNQYDGDTLIEIRMFRIIYLTILGIMTIMIPLVYFHENRGGATLLAFMLLFYVPASINYVYVEIMKK